MNSAKSIPTLPETGKNLTLELLIILALAVIAFVAAGQLDLFERLHGFMEDHEDWELDELLILSLYFVVAGLVFSLRRWRESQRLSVGLRKETERLQAALNEVKLLRGIVPICAWCKKIRDDQGFWQQVDQYVSEHSEVEFTHGMCPECAARKMAELDRDL